MLDTRPPVVASPCSWVARSTSAQVSAGAHARDAPLRVDLELAQPAHVDHEPVVDQRDAGDGVPAGAHGDGRSCARA